MESQESSEATTSTRITSLLTRRDPRRRLDTTQVVQAEVHVSKRQSSSKITSAVPERGHLPPIDSSRPLEATPLDPVAGPSHSRPHIIDTFESRSDSTRDNFPSVSSLAT